MALVRKYRTSPLQVHAFDDHRVDFLAQHGPESRVISKRFVKAAAQIVVHWLVFLVEFSPRRVLLQE